MKAKSKDNDSMLYQISSYSVQIEKQMNKYCLNIIKIIEQDIIPSKNHVKGPESAVFFKKLNADYYRYLCEYPEDQQKYHYYLEQAALNYHEADTLARSNLPQTNPIRLALHLNMSVFLHQQKQESERALELANRAFEEAIANIDTVNE